MPYPLLREWPLSDRSKAEARRAEAGKLAKPPAGVNATSK